MLHHDIDKINVATLHPYAQIHVGIRGTAPKRLKIGILVQILNISEVNPETRYRPIPGKVGMVGRYAKLLIYKSDNGDN